MIKKLVIITLLVLGTPGYAQSSIKQYLLHLKGNGVVPMEVGTVCISGFLHSYLVSSQGVSLVQLFKDGNINSRPNDPVECEE